jgi:hypothetical protein
MEQALLDSSKYKITSLSLDSRFADNVYDGTGDFMIRLPSTMRNIMRIALSSVELPRVEYVFSARHGNLSFSVRVSAGAWTTISIPEGNYTEVEFAAAIEDALQAVNAAFVCMWDPNTRRLTITTTPLLPFELQTVSSSGYIASRSTHWGIGYYMGFRTKETIVSSLIGGIETIVAPSPTLVAATPYYLLQLHAPDLLENITHRVVAGASIPAFAKLVLRDTQYVPQFVDNSDYMRKEYTFLAPTSVSQIRVKILDPYGCPVDMLGMDWSLTVELYEIVNTRTYNQLNMTYERS